MLRNFQITILPGNNESSHEHREHFKYYVNVYYNDYNKTVEKQHIPHHREININHLMFKPLLLKKSKPVTFAEVYAV